MDIREGRGDQGWNLRGEASEVSKFKTNGGREGWIIGVSIS